MPLNILKLTSNNKSYNLVPKEDMLKTLYNGTYNLYEKSSNNQHDSIGVESLGGTIGMSFARWITSIITYDDVSKYKLPYIFLNFFLDFSIAENHSNGSVGIIAKNADIIFPLYFDNFGYYDPPEVGLTFKGSITLEPNVIFYVYLNMYKCHDDDDEILDPLTYIDCYLLINSDYARSNGTSKFKFVDYRSVDLKKIICPNTTELSV